MRYGNPSIPTRAGASSKRQNCERILVAAALSAIRRQHHRHARATPCSALAAANAQPRRRCASSSTSTTIPATSRRWPTSIRDYWMKHGRPGQAGDELPRPAALHAGQGRPLPLRMPEDRTPAGRSSSDSKPSRYAVTFQSRFGRAEWLKPYTAATLEELGRATARPRRRDLPRASSPTAWKRWKKSRWKGAKLSRRRAARNSTTSPPQRTSAMDRRAGPDRAGKSGRLGQRHLGSRRRRTGAPEQQESGPEPGRAALNKPDLKNTHSAR